MGTYTANYNLYMPTIGEQGWGELINGNYQTIDTTMKSFSNRIGTLETETDAVEERVTTLEAGEFESVTADVGNFSSIVLSKTLSYSGYYTVKPGFGDTSSTSNSFATTPIISSSIPFNGVVSAKITVEVSNSTANLYILSTSGLSTIALTSTQTEYSVNNGISVYIVSRSPVLQTLTIGIPVFV